MSYQCNVIEVMIASPSDVSAERQVVRDVLASWNVMHSRSQKAVLLPVGWETHSAPDISGRPQQLINDRLLKHCDLLVGVFWTRLGSPTENFLSGSVEEIENHIDAGKPAMIYFSNQSADLSKLDQDQYNNLIKFKKEMMSRGITSSYDNINEFKSLLERDIQLILNQNEYIKNIFNNEIDKEVSDGKVNASIDIYSAKLLKMASKSSDGMIYNMTYIGGYSISVEGNSLFEGNSPRELARWKGAIDQLENLGLIEALSYKREVFRVTSSGYEVSDQISDEVC